MQYILSKRLYNAEILLQNTDYNVTEIAEIIGYDNPLYFSRIFKKLRGYHHLNIEKNKALIPMRKNQNGSFSFFKICLP